MSDAEDTPFPGLKDVRQSLELSHSGIHSEADDTERQSGIRLIYTEDGKLEARIVDDIQCVDEDIRSRRRAKRRRTRHAERKRSEQALNKRKEAKKQVKKKIAQTKKEAAKSEGNFQSKSARKRGLHRILTLPECTVEAGETFPEEFESKKETDLYAYYRKKLIDYFGDKLIQVNDGDTIEQLLNAELERNAHTSAFNLYHLGFVIKKYMEWRQLLPRVDPYYAVKCNPDRKLVKSLLLCGEGSLGLDCASMAEIIEALELDCPAEKIIFANPCKKIEHIKFAFEKGINLMTFDNFMELDKVKQHHPNAEMILRILSDDSHSIMAFGSKFGATVDEAEELLHYAYQNGIKVIGLSFHVGSGCLSSEGYTNTLMTASEIFQIAKEIGHSFTILDIGGGWPGCDTEALSFEHLAIPVAQTLDDLFPPNIKIIAEPGRYFATETCTLAANIIARRDRKTKVTPSDDNEVVHYYMSDGVYGSFNCIFFDHSAPVPSVLTSASESESDNNSLRETKTSTIFGPTCDSMDVVCKDIRLPSLQVGDWIYFMNMGAYTSAAASSFNGFDPPPATYII